MHATLRRWKLEVQVLAGAPFHVFVADLERHRSRKSDHVGAHPTEGSISNTLHVVTVSIPRCERGRAGASAQPRSGNFQREAPLCAGEANPAAEYNSDAFHSVIAALLFVEETESGRNRLRSPISSSCARQRAEPAVRKTALPSASLGRTSTILSDTREPAALACLGSKSSPGQHRGIRPFSLVCSLTARASGS